MGSDFFRTVGFSLRRVEFMKTENVKLGAVTDVHVLSSAQYPVVFVLVCMSTVLCRYLASQGRFLGGVGVPRGTQNHRQVHEPSYHPSVQEAPETWHDVDLDLIDLDRTTPVCLPRPRIGRARRSGGAADTGSRVATSVGKSSQSGVRRRSGVLRAMVLSSSASA